ncbi:MAG TPA: hypothetical protein VH913_15345 [Hyphomicrobiaceae bacterium]|jgi:hypothetical protein
MTVIQKIVKARDLPPDWAKEFPNPEAQVRVEVREVDATLEAARTLEDVMDLIAERAKERGLTPEILQDILNEQ